MREQPLRRCPVPLMILAVASVSGWSGCASTQSTAAKADSGSRTIEDVIPLTTANIRGHRMLYNEGWFVITSSRKAFAYAKDKSIVSSGEAIREARQRLGTRSSQYAEGLTTDVQHSLDEGKERIKTGTDLTGRILQRTDALAQSEVTYARDTFVDAWEKFVRGHLTLAKRTEDDRRALAALPGQSFANVAGDFSNVWEQTQWLHKEFGGKIEVSWDAAFERAGKEFREEYDRSGEKDNTLLALGPILQGYLKALYHGAAVPTAKTLVHAGATGTAHATAAVFLPIADTSIVAGRTIQSIGLTIFYTGKMGVTLLSPTIEGGLLSGMAMLSLGAVPLTYMSGGTLGAINQVAFTAGTPLYTTGEAVTLTTAQTGRYVGFVAYDAMTGATKVVINQAAAGVVLGYNALSAIPAHLFMGVTDSAILLAWEGPNLVIAKVTGRLRTVQGSHRDSQPTDTHVPTGASAGDLPVGTVVDLNTLTEADGVQVEILSRDPAVIRDVIPRIPCDVRDGHGTCQHE